MTKHILRCHLCNTYHLHAEQQDNTPAGKWFMICDECGLPNWPPDGKCFVRKPGRHGYKATDFELQEVTQL